MYITCYDFQYIYVSAVNDHSTEVCKIDMIAFGKYVYFIRVYLSALFVHEFLLLDIKHLPSFYIINGLHVSIH
jgi:predicted nucleotidyltransferase